MVKRLKILVVDDDPLVARASVALLAAELPECEVIGLTSSAEAIERLRIPDISVLLCDLAMPERDGLAVLSAARYCNPGIVSLLVTGCATKEALVAVINEGGVWKCLEKPCLPDDLIRAVRTALKTLASARGEPANDAFPAGRRPLVVRKSARPAEGKRPVLLRKQEQAQRPTPVALRAGRGSRAQHPLFEHKRYRDLELIQEGNSASVYKARDALLNIPVAIKLISGKVARNRRMMDTLLDEARLAMQLSHRHIVRLHNIEEADASYFLVMEYISGPTFRTLLDERGQIPPATVLQVLDICEDALEYAHRRNIFHRDIKPENLMLTDDGVLKIIDFGIACLAAESARRRDEMCGTPYYLSPEEISGAPLDGRTDLYSLGVVIHELMTGNLPDIGDTQPETPYLYIPRASRDLPDPLRAVLDTSFAMNREQRWTDIHTFAAQFRAAFDRVHTGPGQAPPG